MIKDFQSTFAAKVKKLSGVMAKEGMFKGILIGNGAMCAGNPIYEVSLPFPQAAEDKILLSDKAIAAVKDLPSGELTITTGKNNITMKCGDISMKFAVSDPTTYPKLRDLPNTEATKLAWNDFRDRIEKTLFAVAKATTQSPTLVGVHLQGNGQTLRMETLDGFQLAVATMPCGAEIDCVVDAVVVKALIGLFEGEEIELRQIDGILSFSSPEFKLTTTLIAGKFPNTQNLIPNYANWMKIEPRDMVQMAKRTLLFGGLVKLEVQDAQISVTVQDDLGEYKESLEAIDEGLTYPVTAAYSSRLLVDGFSQFGESAHVGFDNTDSASIRPMVIKGDDLTVLILPVRTK